MPSTPPALEPAVPPAATAFFSASGNDTLTGLTAPQTDAIPPIGLTLPAERALLPTGETTTTDSTLTRPADGDGFQIIVVPHPAGMPDTLLVNRPMSDIDIPVSGTMEIGVPMDTFAHTDANATVKLFVTQADGRPLPPWMRFDPRNGKIEGNPPPGFRGEVVLRVVARDDQGREAVITFRVFIGRDGAQERPAPQGRSSFGEQIRLAGQPLGLASHLAALSASAEAARART